jgi:hypothetical protein
VSGLGTNLRSVEWIPERPPRVSLSVDEIDRKSKRNELVFAVIVAIISVLLGVKLLWRFVAKIRWQMICCNGGLVRE